MFPEACREISHVAPEGEIHRATGITVEVQHSAMTDAERISRETFYGNLVWVVDGRAFRHNFDIYHILPDPASDVAQDVVWAKAERHMNGANAGLFFRWSEFLLERPGATKAEVKSGYIHSIREIEDEVQRAYRGHHQFYWVRPRRTWLDAACPVYLDFGTDFLVKLETYDESGLACIRYVAKRKFVHDVMVETQVHAIATRFYPVAPVGRTTASI